MFKKIIIDELANEGVFFAALSEEIGKDLDPFDIICHVAWDMPPLTSSPRQSMQGIRKHNALPNSKNSNSNLHK